MKKVLTIALTLVLALGTMMPVSASTVGSGDKILGLSTKALDSETQTDLGNLEVRAGDIVEIPLVAGMFTWENGTYDIDANNGTAYVVSTSQLTKGKVKLREGKKVGNKVVESVEIKSKSFNHIDPSNKTAYIEVEFVENLAGTEDVDFELELYVTIDGKTFRDESIYLSGTYIYDVYDVYGEDEEIDLSGGSVAEVDATTKIVKVDTGNEVFLYSRMYSGKKYYAKSTLGYGDTDMNLFDEYKFEMAVYLSTSGFTGNTYVTMKDLGPGWVYDADLNFLGKTSDQLPLKAKYFISNTELDLEEEEVIVDTTPDVTNETAGAGTGTGPVENINMNPNTGR